MYERTSLKMAIQNLDTGSKVNQIKRSNKHKNMTSVKQGHEKKVAEGRRFLLIPHQREVHTEKKKKIEKQFVPDDDEYQS